MLVYFRMLALQTGSCPLANIRVDVGQMKCAVSSFCVVLIPGCERECNESKIALRKLTGTYRRGVPIDTSHSNITSVVVAGTGLSDKEELPWVNSCS